MVRCQSPDESFGVGSPQEQGSPIDAAGRRTAQNKQGAYEVVIRAIIDTSWAGMVRNLAQDMGEGARSISKTNGGSRFRWFVGVGHSGEIQTGGGFEI